MYEGIIIREIAEELVVFSTLLTEDNDVELFGPGSKVFGVG